MKVPSWLPATVLTIAAMNFVAIATQWPTSTRPLENWEPAILLDLVPLAGAVHLAAIVHWRQAGRASGRPLHGGSQRGV